MVRTFVVTPSCARMLFFFDYADPLSWAVELLARRSEGWADTLQRFPYGSGELGQGWQERVEHAELVLGGLEAEWTAPLAPVRSQKAFELAFHAAELGCFEAVHARIFEAHFRSGCDIGRIDELVGVGEREGLDPSKVKAVLDVDRHAEAVRSWHARALAAGVMCTPALVNEGTRIEGLAALEIVRTVPEG